MKAMLVTLPLILFALAWLLPASASGAVQSKKLEYQDGGATLQGYLAWDDAVSGKRPAILVLPEWWGVNDYIRQRADMLAKLGYVALAVDMYGQGQVTEHPGQAKEWAEKIMADVGAWRQRAMAALKALRDQPMVDPGRVAAIGYCFGGSTVMQMAYAGADLAGVASFHGSLPVARRRSARQDQGQGPGRPWRGRRLCAAGARPGL